MTEGGLSAIFFRAGSGFVLAYVGLFQDSPAVVFFESIGFSGWLRMIMEGLRFFLADCLHIVSYCAILYLLSRPKDSSNLFLIYPLQSVT